MIFAAGLGTRLRPLTDSRPKALVELNGMPLLERVILKMRRAGICRIIVNVHHYAAQIEDFLRSRQFFGGEVVVSDERGRLLDTGGGLRAARALFLPDEPVVVHNVDILAPVDLKELVRLHRRKKYAATLAVRPGCPGRRLRFDAAGLLKGWEDTLTGERKTVGGSFDCARPYSFCGIQVVSPSFLQHMVYEGVFSIIDEYLAQASRRPVGMYFYDGPFLDLGTPAAVAEGQKWPESLMG